MANRSYLIGMKANQEDKIISAYAYDIPAFYKIFVSGNPTIVRSKMFEIPNEDTPAIQGNFEGGKQKLFKYIDTLATTILNDYDELKEKLLAEKAKIDSLSFDSICLDCLEIFDMDDDADQTDFFSKKNTELFNQLSNTDDIFNSYCSLLSVELRKYDGINAINPSGLFKAKKIKQKEEDLNNQKRVIEEMLLIGFFDNN